MARISKLNDLHYVLLATAALRASGSLLPPSTSSGVKAARASLAKAIRALIARGLAEEVTTSDAESVWREEADERFAVVITDAGRAALNLAYGKTPVETTAPPAADACLEVVSADLSGPPPMAEPAARAGTKRALLIGMLRRDGGATLDELVTATGWLPHTTRAALTGLRKKGHAIATERLAGVTRYRIATVA